MQYSFAAAHSLVADKRAESDEDTDHNQYLFGHIVLIKFPQLLHSSCWTTLLDLIPVMQPTIDIFVRQWCRTNTAVWWSEFRLVSFGNCFSIHTDGY